MKRLLEIFFKLILPIVVVAVISAVFKINTIICTVSETSCSSNLYKKLEFLKGKSLFFTNIENELNKNDIGSETILLNHYQKKFPGTIYLTFSQEKILYKYIFENNSQFISEFGNKVQIDEYSSPLPEVNWNSTFTNTTHQKIYKIINSLLNTNLTIEKITRENDNEIIINIKNNPKIIINSENIDSKLGNLKTLLESREIKDYREPIKEIDLRFNLPVLRTTQ